VNGEAALTRELTARLIKVFRSGGRARRLLLSDRRVELTAREFEVLERLRLGEPTGRIASQLGISDVTVRRHISAILQKLGVPDRQSALELLDREDQRRRERDSETYAQSG
jgi:DNA-binding NarL/FixJ family response regulator